MTKRLPTAPLTGPGSELWRTTEERDDQAALHDAVVQEFPAGASELEGASRREFMQLMGASLALAGVGTIAGCKDPPERIMPYNIKPTDVTPGRPLHYATALSHGGVGAGVLVTAWEGRPTKVEGNPDHPVSRGTTSTLAQAEILSLYDAERSRELREGGRGRSWQQFCEALTKRLATYKDDGGARLAFLVEPDGSPLVASLQKRIAELFPKAGWYGHAAVSLDGLYEGSRIAFGRPLETQYDLSKARVVVALDADPLGGQPRWTAQQQGWAERRRPGADMGRLYVAEAALSCTGMMADHRLRSRSSDISRLARALYAAVSGGGADAGDPKAVAWVRAVAKDLSTAGSEAVVLVGERQPAAVHALAHAINATIKSGAVSYTAPVLPSYEPLTTLIEQCKAGKVDTLVITAWNPVYSASEKRPEEWLPKVPNSIYLASHDDETAALANWTVPRAHDLECWGDARAFDGTVTLRQPLLQPLFGGHSLPELLAACVGEGMSDGFRLLRDSYKGVDNATFDRQLQKGLIDGSALPKESVALQAGAVTSAADRLGTAAAGLELNLVPDAKLYDGRYANNVWLQELPDPITKLTWDNALLLSPATAEKLELKLHDRAEVKVGDKSLEVSVIPSPGHADESATLALGYGRRRGVRDEVKEAGVDAYPLRALALWFAPGVTVERQGSGPKLAITQEHWAQEGRPIALDVTNRAAMARHLPLVEELRAPVESMYTAHEYTGYKWAMAIDLNKCSGCSACVVACQAENNTPVVGRDQVRRSREMHWLRLDIYFAGDENELESAHPQPMACVHCEKAPCEYVCPVNATVHSDEGLNEMVYNRCVGTRYCSNNCPYKVRRFNYLDFHPNVQGVARMVFNPDVTVRSRGVIEKCSYCVQRIERSRIEARVAGRPIKDGEIVSACAQACPSRAIVFGSLHDKASEVSKWHDDPRAYHVLHELGTRPRTAYLARVKNKNPELTNG